MGKDGRIKVLHIVNKWERGGVERFVETLVDKCDISRFDQGILSICTGVDSNANCAKHGPLCSGSGMRSMLLGARKLKAFLLDHHYDVVHVHTNNSSGYLYCNAALKAGVSQRVIHSHNSSLGLGAGVGKRVAQQVLRMMYSGSETTRLACSHEAGEHLFPGNQYQVIPNGVDVRRFSFDLDSRKRIRGDLDVADNDILIGCVGSLIPAKNHLRALDIFADFNQEHPMSKLVIVGDGELRLGLENAAAQKGLSNRVAFVGFVEDCAPYYCAMDVLLFPSLYEGLPIALIEAQCSGLPIVMSDGITRESILTDNVKRLSLDASDKEWSAAIRQQVKEDRASAGMLIEKAEFDASSTINKIERIWIEGR